MVIDLAILALTAVHAWTVASIMFLNRKYLLAKGVFSSESKQNSAKIPAIFF